MQAQEITIDRYGPAGSMGQRQRDLTAPLGDDEVTIDVKYSGINFADIQMRVGLYPDAPPKPFVPGYEVSGVVEAVGANVTNVGPGDEVVAGTFFGGYASRVTIPSYQAFLLPKTTRLDEGAALPVNFFTAQVALFEMGRVRAGDKVLIECATGGVGTLAIQMARHVGAEVVGLTTSPHKKDYIRALGATAMTREEFEADATQRDFDFILNASGGRTVRQQMKRLDFTGRIVCIGFNASLKNGRRSLWRAVKGFLEMPLLPVLSLFNHNRGVYGLNALRILEDPRWAERLTKSLATIDEMGLRPHVAKIFPAEDVAGAHSFLETKQATGKVLLAW